MIIILESLKLIQKEGKLCLSYFSYFLRLFHKGLS